MNLPGHPAIIAIIGAGEMGATVGCRLREADARPHPTEWTQRRERR
jgi:predicted dinucleotide-binding enzyme